MKRTFLILASIAISAIGCAQEIKLQGVYPTNWWVGMKNPNLQLMVHADGVTNNSFSINYPGVKLVKTTKVENPNYVFLDLVVSPAAKPGTVKINWKNKTASGNISYTLQQRRKGKGTEYAQGVTTADFVYLIMPDRFSNGDASNDKLPGMFDQSLNRDSLYHRHGGDLQGVADHLDYVKELGATAIWLNPVLTNDMAHASYHGYAFTNHYEIDPRFGGNTAYKTLVGAAHQKGLKMIQDAVYNHVGTNHFFVKDQPTKDWLHQWPTYTNTTYKDQVLFDPHASEADKKRMSDGWFVPSMPDLNQNNPLLATFLIQHAIWSVEEFGIDGWRIDTYAYNDLDFMNRCNKALLDEYPKLSIFGETWVHGVPNQSYFTRNNYTIPYKSNQPGVTDFQTYWGITETMTKDFGWTDGVNKLYTTLAQDFVYQDPTKNVIFFDNHDLSRFYSVIGEDMDKYKMSIAWLLTARGVPQWYYGAEILMKGMANPDGWVRLDFPGGWPGDKVNKFTAAGRTKEENTIFDYTKTLANFRKTSSALTTGKLMQFVPEDAVYTYFRYNDQQTIMVVMNTGKEEKTIDVARFAERTSGFSFATDIISNTKHELKGSWKVPAKTAWVLQLNKNVLVKKGFYKKD